MLRTKFHSTQCVLTFTQLNQGDEAAATEKMLREQLLSQASEAEAEREELEKEVQVYVCVSVSECV